MKVTTPHNRIVGDTLNPLSVILNQGGIGPYDLTGYTVEFVMEKADGTPVVAPAASLVKHPTQVFTASPTDDLLVCIDHGAKEQDRILLFNSGGGLPAPLATEIRYFAADSVPDFFALKTHPDKAPIDITTAGTGTHTFTVMGSVQVVFEAAAVATVGKYKGWFKLTKDGKSETVPNHKDGIPINILALGNWR